ncbi:hypothetical protein ATANTOWER_004434 [Ataeniobius toweri]|uniref:Secreted protein n=1 Tax=Ataeniobius toweri TaxID=208326 RepID=A0ABU7BXC6_9TELE|nr:hypothetical protein [Ataeniobius toweri]
MLICVSLFLHPSSKSATCTVRGPSNTHTCPPHVSLSGDGQRAERRGGRALVQLTSSLLSSPPPSNRALPCRQAG